jgi:hypothetical protein
LKFKIIFLPLRRKFKSALFDRSNKKNGSAANIFSKHYITASSHLTFPAKAPAKQDLSN